MVDALKKDLMARRADLLEIADIIQADARVLDLGCGDGILLKYLREAKNVKGCGVELFQNKLIDCIANGVPVIQKDLNEGLTGFPDDSYDYVILSQTLQAVKRPDILLDEMLRVGKKVVISFINFGYYKISLQLLFKGEMPKTKTLPDSWYDTANIHLGSLHDFETMCKERDAVIVQRIPLGSNNLRKKVRIMPNMFAQTCVFVVSRNSD